MKGKEKVALRSLFLIIIYKYSPPAGFSVLKPAKMLMSFGSTGTYQLKFSHAANFNEFHINWDLSTKIFPKILC